MEWNIQSYLQARDPSIQAYNRTNLQEVKANLNDLMAKSSTEGDEHNYINVYLRIRGDMQDSGIYKINGNNLICKVPNASHCSRNIKTSCSIQRTYNFTKIFGPESTQRMIFNNIIKPKLLTFINGRNFTLFAYGASGSGKTFTMVGTPEEPGVIPRALEYIFRSLPKISNDPDIKPLPNGRTVAMSRRMIEEETQYKDNIINATLPDQAAHIRTYKQMQDRLSCEPVANVDDSSNVSTSIWVSFTEIYNETLYDLLSIPAAPHQLRPKLALGLNDDNTYIKKLTYVNVKTGLEAYQVLQYGLHNLNYASTAINAHSSRSHGIFSVRLVQSSKDSSDVYVSTLNFSDLAGSERLKKTMNLGDRLKESNSINNSLLVLGRCMENIKKCQQLKDRRLIPFRESKLTQIFQKALLGNENVEMIVNINPLKEMFDESIHVLNFSAIAKSIIVEEEQPKPIRKENRFSLLIEEENARLGLNNQVNVRRVQSTEEELRKLKRENRRLKEQLQQQSGDNDKNVEIEKLIDAIDKLYEEREKLIASYEQTIKQEKQFVANTYKGILERAEEMHMKAKASALASLREVYEHRIAAIEVITISSSDEEGSPQKKSPGIGNNILHFQKLVDEQLVKLSEYEKIITEKDNLLEKLVTELEDRDNKLKDRDSVIEDAKNHCRELEATSNRNYELYQQERSTNFFLQEKIDLLEKSLTKLSEDSAANDGE